MYPFLEEVCLNLLDVPSKQKVSIINSLNENLKTIKLVFFQPISFLLCIGTRFANLETLDVGFTSDRFNVPYKHHIEHCKYFDKLHNKNLIAFRNLKKFKLNICNIIERLYYPLLLCETVVTILRYCEKTLTSFELEYYNFDSVKVMVDFICSRNMPLEFISFKAVYLLTDRDVMKFAKAFNGSELSIQIEGCYHVTAQGLKAVLSYIEENNLKIKIKHDKTLD